MRKGFSMTHATVIREPLHSSKEVAAEFGYKNINSLDAVLSHGCFPEPDVVMTNMRGRKRLYWKLSTLKKEKERRLKKSVRANPSHTER
jgi:hypothetical protein